MLEKKKLERVIDCFFRYHKCLYLCKFQGFVNNIGKSWRAYPEIQIAIDIMKQREHIACINVYNIENKSFTIQKIRKYICKNWT